MSQPILDQAQLARALSLRDLTDPSQDSHVMQLLIESATQALKTRWGCQLHLRRASPITTVADNYDALGYPAEGIARDARYTRYLGDGRLLRTQTSAMIPAILRELSQRPPDDVVLVCPGLVYRRDSIDRLHTGEPHQIDLWRISARSRVAEPELNEMIALVVEATLPGMEWRSIPAEHPYTLAGRQLDVRHEAEWVEIGECGLAHPDLLKRSGLPAHATGLAMGLGLDRIVMLRKGVPDIRLLRSTDPRVHSQMLNLCPYRVVSLQPPTRRDLSIAVPMDDTAEDLGDRVRQALGEEARCVETVEVLSETLAGALPPAAVERLGLEPHQKNVLVRIVLRDVDRTLTDSEANRLRNDVYRALHRGRVQQWAQDGS